MLLTVVIVCMGCFFLCFAFQCPKALPRPRNSSALPPVCEVRDAKRGDNVCCLLFVPLAVLDKPLATKIGLFKYLGNFDLWGHV